MYGKVLNMPKPGFKSITISEAVYDKFNQAYLKNKNVLTMKGVNIPIGRCYEKGQNFCTLCT